MKDIILPNFNPQSAISKYHPSSTFEFRISPNFAWNVLSNGAPSWKHTTQQAASARARRTAQGALAAQSYSKWASDTPPLHHHRRLWQHWLAAVASHCFWLLPLFWQWFWSLMWVLIVCHLWCRDFSNSLLLPCTCTWINAITSFFCALWHAIFILIQNKRRMKRRGRWQPTKRFLPVLVCNWIFGLFGLFLSNRGADRGADIHSNKSLTSYSRQHSPWADVDYVPAYVRAFIHAIREECYMFF